MELTEMFLDSLIYPSKNIKALCIYILLSVIVGIVAVSTGVTTVFAGDVNVGAGVIVAIIGLIISIVLLLLIDGYALDIIKIAIDRGEGAPVVDFNRQVSNGLKYFIVSFVYMLIPIIVSLALLFVFRNWIVSLIFVILFIIFCLGLSMAECRLAQSDSLAYALDIKGSLDDLLSLGVVRVIITIVAIALISMIIMAVVGAIFGLLGSDMLTSIVMSVVSVYLLFFSNRVFGLLYSEL